MALLEGWKKFLPLEEHNRAHPFSHDIGRLDGCEKVP